MHHPHPTTTGWYDRRSCDRCGHVLTGPEIAGPPETAMHAAYKALLAAEIEAGWVRKATTIVRTTTRAKDGFAGQDQIVETITEEVIETLDLCPRCAIASEAPDR